MAWSGEEIRAFIGTVVLGRDVTSSGSALPDDAA
jgi:hypothetical protein